MYECVSKKASLVVICISEAPKGAEEVATDEEKTLKLKKAKKSLLTPKVNCLKIQPKMKSVFFSEL